MHKGFAPILFLIGTIILIIVVAGSYFYYQKNISSSVKNSAKNADAQMIVYEDQLTPTSTPTSPPDETANWKTYRSSRGKFEIKYPNNMTVYTEETVAENEVAHLILHSSSSLAFSITVFSETGNVSCNAKNYPPNNILEKVIVDDEEGCFSEGNDIDVPDMEGRAYNLEHNGFLYSPGFSWKTGEKDSKLIELMMSTFKFID